MTNEKRAKLIRHSSFVTRHSILGDDDDRDGGKNISTRIVVAQRDGAHSARRHNLERALKVSKSAGEEVRVREKTRDVSQRREADALLSDDLSGGIPKFQCN